MSTPARVALLGFLVAVVIAMWVFAFLSKHFEKVASCAAAASASASALPCVTTTL